MIRKPMLFDKISGKSGYYGREVIGLIGTHHGVGVTFTGLLLAFYLGEFLGRKTAFLECNNSHDMDLIGSAYEWYQESTGALSFHQITCFKAVSGNQIAEIFGDDFECIILDFGCDFSMNKEEFMRSQTKVVVGGRSEWEQRKLTRFIQMVEPIRGSETWLHLIPQASMNMINKLKKETNRNFWAIPFVEEPTLSSGKTNHLFDSLFRN